MDLRTSLYFEGLWSLNVGHVGLFCENVVNELLCRLDRGDVPWFVAL